MDKQSSANNPYADLPRVVYMLGTDDYGEFGAATCPHCGAKGRYVKNFVCEDGTHRGAMAGCFKHFPKHPLAVVHDRIMEKLAEYNKKGWDLPTWDQKSLRAIEDFANQIIDEQQAISIVEQQERSRQGYLARRFSRGRRR